MSPWRSSTSAWRSSSVLTRTPSTRRSWSAALSSSPSSPRCTGSSSMSSLYATPSSQRHPPRRGHRRGHSLGISRNTRCPPCRRVLNSRHSHERICVTGSLMRENLMKTPNFTANLKPILDALKPNTEVTCPISGEKRVLTQKEIDVYRKHLAPPKDYAPVVRMQMLTPQWPGGQGGGKKNTPK